MNNKISSRWRISKIIGFLCVVILFTMIGATIANFVKSEYYFAITPTSYPPIKISKNGGYYTNTLIIIGSGKADLWVLIEDLDGNIIHKQQYLNMSAFSSVSNKNIKLRIPSLKPDYYRVVGILHYTTNFIMQSRITIDMGSIIVEDNNE